MAIGGFWHGAGLNFIFWGAIHSLGLIVNHLCKDIPQAIHLKLDYAFPRFAKFCSWLLTFSFVTCSWVFFGTPNWKTAVNFFQ